MWNSKFTGKFLRLIITIKAIIVKIRNSKQKNNILFYFKFKFKIIFKAKTVIFGTNRTDFEVFKHWRRFLKWFFDGFNNVERQIKEFKNITKRRFCLS